MRIADANWMQIEDYLRKDDRCVLPLGSTEQHAWLSLATDSILAERVAVDAAEPLGIPVFPVTPYGITPMFRAYPGTVSLRVETFLALVEDVLNAVAGHGFRRILVVNGHGGNSPVQGLLQEWAAGRPGVQVRLHMWWNTPRVWACVQHFDPVASHASWMENFPWTRLPGVASPEDVKPMTDLDRLRLLDPAGVRATLGDGNFGGRFQRPDEEMAEIWRTGVEETRELLERGWL
ncbi:MAG TPA: creatininase family protein [Candidatus Eisenbacteria bacterium]|nr:creatininase family protein [Candidatus Eisenbacteria bacterium]